MLYLISIANLKKIMNDCSFKKDAETTESTMLNTTLIRIIVVIGK